MYREIAGGHVKNLPAQEQDKQRKMPAIAAAAADMFGVKGGDPAIMPGRSRGDSASGGEIGRCKRGGPAGAGSTPAGTSFGCTSAWRPSGWDGRAPKGSAEGSSR